jgi:hypothetical protein
MAEETAIESMWFLLLESPLSEPEFKHMFLSGQKEYG